MKKLLLTFPAVLGTASRLAGFALFLGLFGLFPLYSLDQRPTIVTLLPESPGLTGTAIGNRVKVADGEYQILQEGNSGAVGPDGREIYDFQESWTLWRNANGRYELEGERSFESPRWVKNTNRFEAQLSRDLTPNRMTEFLQFPPGRERRAVSCEFLSSALHCSSPATHLAREINLRLAVTPPYGFIWPISPFSLSGLTRQAERDPEHASPVQLVFVAEPIANEPISPLILAGQLQYAEKQNLFIANRAWEAYKFSLKIPSHPALLLWTSSEGVLLSVKTEHADARWPVEGMQLTRFHQWAEFSDHPALNHDR